MPVTVQVLQEADPEMDMEVFRNLLGVEGDSGRERREGLRSEVGKLQTPVHI